MDESTGGNVGRVYIFWLQEAGGCEWLVQLLRRHAWVLVGSCRYALGNGTIYSSGY